MSYAVQDNVKLLLSRDFYTQLETNNQIDDADYAIYASMADLYVNGKLKSKGVKLPLVTVPDGVVQSANLYTCYLIARGVYFQNTENKNEWVASYLEQTDELLDALLEDAAATFGAANITSFGEVAASTTTDEDRVFTITKTKDFRVIEDENGYLGGTMGGLGRW